MTRALIGASAQRRADGPVSIGFDDIGGAPEEIILGFRPDKQGRGLADHVKGRILSCLLVFAVVHQCRIKIVIIKFSLRY